LSTGEYALSLMVSQIVKKKTHFVVNLPRSVAVLFLALEVLTKGGRGGGEDAGLSIHLSPFPAY